MTHGLYLWSRRGPRARRPGCAAACLAIVAIAGWSAAPQPQSETRSAVEVAPRTDSQRALALELSVDVWSEHVRPDQPFVVVVTGDDLDRLADEGVPHRIVVEDIDAEAAGERERLRRRARGAAASDWYSEYRDIHELNQYIDRLAEHHPDTIRLSRLGTSIEGWPIRALEISRGGAIGVALNGGHHAREWISVMVPICIADRLANSDDPRVDSILRSVRFFVVPLVNPDGYVYSWSADRYWRKNRRGGYGVDLNRNYSVAWGGPGSSGRPDSQNYRGRHAFSEPESRAMRNLFDSHDIAAHLDFHSYSQLILYPWHYQRADPPDRDKFAAVADRMTSAMYAEHQERYEIVPGSQIGAISGVSTDWTYGEHGALSFTVELRPPSRRGGGFVLPPEQIVPTCDESYAAVLELGQWLVRSADTGR